MTAGGATSSEHRLCALVSKANGEDPIGSAKPAQTRFLVEVAQPWQRDALTSRRLAEELRQVIEGAQARNLLGAFSALLPDREYSRKGHTRFLFFRRPPGPFAHHEKEEFLVPDGELASVVRSLLERPRDLSRFERYRQETGHVRDLLVCTHGGRDVCCGKFGYPIYDLLRRRYGSGGRMRVWRTSHLGGHRFAPTMVEYPEGRFWGHLEPWVAQRLAERRGPVSELRPFCRGWSGLRTPVEQVAEREIFAREGWAWSDYLKAGEVLRTGEDEAWAEVRITYGSVDGHVAGAYEALVEAHGTVMTLASSGTDPLEAAVQYRVARLERVAQAG